MVDEVTLKNMAFCPDQYEQVICYHDQDENTRIVHFRYKYRVFRFEAKKINIQGNEETFVGPLEELDDHELRSLITQFHHIPV